MVLSGQIPLWWVIASVQWFGRWATWLWALLHVISVSIGEPFFSIHHMGAHRRESSTRTSPSPDIKSANDFPASRPLVKKKKSLVYNFTQPAVCCYGSRHRPQQYSRKETQEARSLSLTTLNYVSYNSDECVRCWLYTLISDFQSSELKEISGPCKSLSIRNFVTTARAGLGVWDSKTHCQAKGHTEVGDKSDVCGRKGKQEEGSEKNFSLPFSISFWSVPTLHTWEGPQGFIRDHGTITVKSEWIDLPHDHDH